MPLMDGRVAAVRAGRMAAIGGVLLLAGASVAPAASSRTLPAQNPQATLDRAERDFAAGDFEAAATGFDRVAEMLPGYAPQLWQRGIALYYVGRYQDCREQFESHRLVNPNDVENAAWHFLCVARGESPEQALADILPVGPDRRTPLPEIYRMFRGELSADEVLAAAGAGMSAQFYAHLYIALYAEAMGDDDVAREQIAVAAADRFANYGGYMHMVARVHRNWLEGR